MILFRTLRSGSSGNLLLLESRRAGTHTRLMIDCGLPSQRACREILEAEIGLSRPLDGLLVTHAHSDHVNYAALRVIDQLGIPLLVHERTAAEVGQRYLNPYRLPQRVDFSSLKVRCFGDQPFQLDGLGITPVAVPHAPGVTTHAFVIRCGEKRILIASDFHDPDAVVPAIYDCDLIYLESNHDPDLLRRYWNPASLFHLPNPAAGLLLDHAVRASRRPPQVIVLGHLSEERNRPELALTTVQQALGETEAVLVAAPRHAAGEVVVLEA